MDALQLIKDNLDVELVLGHYDFDQTRPSGNYYRACCKLHEGNNPTGFVISIDTGLWSCHTGDCGSGDIFHLVQRLEDVSFPVAVHKVADVLGLDIANLEIVARTQQEKKELRRFLEAMKSVQRQEIDAYEPIGEIKTVKKFKEFDLSTIERFGLTYFTTFHGSTSKGEPMTLHDRLGFPMIFGSKQIGISLRATKKGEPNKWIHQPPNMITGNILYNYDSVIGESEVVVVEGITDVWAYYEIGLPAVATYGAHLTKEQVRLLLQLGADLVFSFDNDEAGRIAMQKAYDTFRYTSNIKFVHLPLGCDPENIPREDLTTYYEQKNNYPI